MSKKSRPPYAPVQRAGEPLTLAHVVLGLGRPGELSATRLRDLRSAVRRVAALLGNEPAAIAVDMRAIAAGLAAINPVAAGLTSKRMANVRSDFVAAIKASGGY